MNNNNNNNNNNYDVVNLHLPNGKVYELYYPNTINPLTPNAITELRNVFGKCDYVDVSVKPDSNDTNNLVQSKILILWGDTLKNSYISIDRR